jgi:NAD(P)-dependent dehydrogenase (short-subunit alcohol dehydrogenase family)
MSSRDLKGQAAVVTGGTRGIGRAIVDTLAAEGMNVAICGRNDEDVRRVADEISGRGAGRVIGKACDVADYAAASALVKSAVEEFGRLDVLVNNAGIGGIAPIAEMEPEDFRRVIETNLIGAFNCCHAALPRMKRGGGGYIINISSLAGKNAFAGGTAYNASKFGLNGFSEALMQDVRYDNIRVSYVMPGSVATEFNGNDPAAGADWKLSATDVAEVVLGLLRSDPRALASRVELRPSKPAK